MIKKSISVVDNKMFVGLFLVPNGEYLGYVMGDVRPQNDKSYHAPHRVSVTVTDITNSSLIDNSEINNSHPWGIFFTVLGTVLLDFDADACQSPARAYLLDVTVTGMSQIIILGRRR